ncbi:hypothetical protein ACFWFC_18380, partial [Streptomyces venezuelae]
TNVSPPGLYLKGALLAVAWRAFRCTRLYLRRPTEEHRHYLICRDCGRSRAVDAGAVEAWAGRLAESTGFAELEHTLELSGVCGPCRSAQLCTPSPDMPGASSGRSTRSSS